MRARGLLAVGALLTALTGPAAGQSLPVHGNWCGPGYSGANAPYPAPPTDPLDAACMRHDICKGVRGRFDCGCDIGFMRELRAIPWPNPGLASKGRAIYEAIGLLPCSTPEGQAVKMGLVAGDWANNVVAGREAPWEILGRLSRLAATGLSRAGW